MVDFIQEIRTGDGEEVKRIWGGLCSAIVLQAIIDYRLLNHGETVRRVIDAHTVYSLEVEDFFLSRWFEMLLGSVLPEIDPEMARERFSATKGEINDRQAHRTEEQKKIEKRFLKVNPQFKRTDILYGGKEPESPQTTRKRKRRKRKTAHNP